MKIKKAAKRLEEVEELLASVIDRYREVEAPQRTLLQDAQNNVARVKAALQEADDHKAATTPPPATKRAVRKANKPDAQK